MLRAQLRDYGYQVDTGIGGTGVTGVLKNGTGSTVLLRADMDALPVKEDTGAAYSGTVTAKDAEGYEVPVMHACGHDIQVSCLLGAAKLTADRSDQGMVDDGIPQRMPAPDVALGQHVLPGGAGTVGTHAGPFLTSADSMKVTVYGRAGHGAMPQNTVDPVVLVAMVVVRLQTVVSRETPPAETAVLTIGSIQAGSKSNIIPHRAVIALNVRTYSPQTRQRMQEAIRRIVRAECLASG
ncbi:M20/M25/M40 family metallo-hydrolase [Arthrobacter terrae]|uniref:M20/M25/M40 family metallo-hydrolase n=1 Tax=Arthrobacter terrae TaxID=2935737 RepID=UPI001E39D153|nr:M20/M25/M40 family metallo-hydrolase [Arthrobacter terrae]